MSEGPRTKTETETFLWGSEALSCWSIKSLTFFASASWASRFLPLSRNQLKIYRAIWPSHTSPYGHWIHYEWRVCGSVVNTTSKIQVRWRKSVARESVPYSTEAPNISYVLKLRPLECSCGFVHVLTTLAKQNSMYVTSASGALVTIDDPIEPLSQQGVHNLNIKRACPSTKSLIKSSVQNFQTKAVLLGRAKLE